MKFKLAVFLFLVLSLVKASAQPARPLRVFIRAGVKIQPPSDAIRAGCWLHSGS